jgi:hypothetical protein
MHYIISRKKGINSIQPENEEMPYKYIENIKIKKPEN